MSTSDLDRIAGAQEVILETRDGDVAAEVIVWVVVHDGDLYIRSLKGSAGSWYKAIQENPDVVLSAEDARVSFRAVPADDDASVLGASEGFRRKYPNEGQWLDAMLVPEILHTTLRLDPLP